MAHFARIDENNIVQEINVINNDDIGGGGFPDSEPLGQSFQAALGIEGTWLQCSYSGSFRGAYPGPGWMYDAVADEFVIIPPTPEEMQ